MVAQVPALTPMSIQIQTELQVLALVLLVVIALQHQHALQVAILMKLIEDAIVALKHLSMILQPKGVFAQLQHLSGTKALENVVTLIHQEPHQAVHQVLLHQGLMDQAQLHQAPQALVH